MSFVVPAPRFTDPAVFGQVAVLMGGTSAEREVSLQSGQGVLDALRSRGVDAQPVDGIPALVDAIRAGGVDRVFNILHGNRGGGEDGVVQGLLEALGVPYTGPGVLGSALTMDKVRTKQVWIAEGLPTPRFLRLPPDRDVRAAIADIGLPVFVKPSCEGSSVGVARVADANGIEDAVRVAREYGGEMLVEPLVVGDELTVGILGDLALPSIRIVPKGEWYDYHAKYVSDDTRYLCPGLEGDEEARIGEIALAAFRAAGCSGWGRVDLMRDRASGELLLLEVNTAPGMTSHSLVPKAAAQVGIDYADLCWRVLEQTVPADAASTGGAA
ncbi:D-alanine--D-alanine ligase [Luteimonas kalidii]|uniref:D-alanine--D-alanine ligase n=1 Tax=Luteimonas kalidii TaxID=3042025 RepID=A0ABT6JQQ7_9GAMM|nr:D-alanine--D-alanine ligase [Luteimonas kalidii]MDH5833021.1 D-alanine--D-alanine ligase [Luteimonas kalidii]